MTRPLICREAALGGEGRPGDGASESEESMRVLTGRRGICCEVVVEGNETAPSESDEGSR